MPVSELLVLSTSKHIYTTSTFTFSYLVNMVFPCFKLKLLSLLPGNVLKCQCLCGPAAQNWVFQFVALRYKKTWCWQLKGMCSVRVRNDCDHVTTAALSTQHMTIRLGSQYCWHSSNECQLRLAGHKLMSNHSPN